MLGPVEITMEYDLIEILKEVSIITVYNAIIYLRFSARDRSRELWSILSKEFFEGV